MQVVQSYLKTFSIYYHISLFDVLCISLGLNLFDRVYYLLCGPLDRCLKSCGARDAIKREQRKKLEMELAICAVLSNQQCAGDDTIVEVPDNKELPFCE